MRDVAGSTRAGSSGGRFRGDSAKIMLARSTGRRYHFLIRIVIGAVPCLTSSLQRSTTMGKGNYRERKEKKKPKQNKKK